MSPLSDKRAKWPVDQKKRGVTSLEPGPSQVLNLLTEKPIWTRLVADLGL